MALLVVLVLDDPDQCTDILDAWEATGVHGVTILESTGIGRMRRMGILDDLPLLPSLSDLLKSRETPHRTLFSVVPDQEKAQELVAATQHIIGNLDQEHTGLLFVVPVAQVYGIGNPDRKEE